MPTTTTYDDLEEAQAMEQYGHPLAELVSERYTVEDVLEAAISNWTYRPTPSAL